MSKDKLINLYSKHIKDTQNKELIKSIEIDIGSIPTSVKVSLGIHSSKIHITSFALKHIYDKHLYKHHLANDFTFILNNIRSVVQKPDLVTSNNPSRKGDYCFIKTIESQTIICSIQITNAKLYIVTAFILKDQGYLKGSSLLWKF
jgi:hypothetical protein